jgi:cephalosporin-C deacetylase-like acetyl esterase
MIANIVFIGMVFIAVNASATSFAAEREAVLALAEHTSAPAMQDASPDAATGSTANLRAVYFDGLPYQGAPTKVFAWLGLPENRSGKVPGIVLVHGGGGTAFKEWVKLWNDHGFAAISIFRWMPSRPRTAPHPDPI